MIKKIFGVSVFVILVILAVNMLAHRAAASDKNVTVIDLSGDWEAAGDLQWQALLLSLQGIANKYGPHIYLVYPDDSKHPDVKAVLEYYQKRHHIKTTKLTSVEDAVTKYRHYLKGYVVWDTAIVPSLMVSFTVAGLGDALVVTEKYPDWRRSLVCVPWLIFMTSSLEILIWKFSAAPSCEC